MDGAGAWVSIGDVKVPMLAVVTGEDSSSSSERKKYPATMASRIIRQSTARFLFVELLSPVLEYLSFTVLSPVMARRIDYYNTAACRSPLLQILFSDEQELH
jgi:hypothetical protein